MQLRGDDRTEAQATVWAVKVEGRGGPGSGDMLGVGVRLG